MNVKPSEVLVEALRLIEAGWTQQLYARDSEGISVNPISDEACSWCAMGAMERARYNLKIPDGYGSVWKAEGYLRDVIGTYSIIDWNDTRRKKETVVGAFTKAIKNAKEIEEIDEHR